MKNYITTGLLFAGLALSLNICAQDVSAATYKSIKADIQTIQIPAGSTLKLQLMDPLSTKIGSIGDEFSAMLTEDKIVNSKIALPQGSVIRGTISKIVPAKRLSKSAVMYLKFDHVVTPTGRQIPLTAGLYNYGDITLDGGIYSGGNYGYAIQENWKTTKGIFKKTVDWGKGTGENMQYLCTPLGAIGGVFGGGVYYVGADIADLFKKGNNVNIPQGQNVEIMLTQPLDIPLH